jgi:hypothetical protein
MRTRFVVPVLAMVAIVGTVSAAAPQACAASEPKYSVQGCVLESAEHGPELGFVLLESSPPRCGGIPLVGWDWDDVDPKSTIHDTTWGSYRLVGTYDGKRFHVIKVGPQRVTRRSDGELIATRLATRCDTPPGGWVNRDPSKLGILDQSAMGDAAQASPDFVTMWMDRSQAVPVQNIAFTGPPEQHRAELEAIWGGALCLVQVERSMAELESIQSSLTTESLQKLGLEFVGSHIDELRSRVGLSVLIADRGAQRRVDHEFGKGVVEVSSVFERVR